MMVQMHLACYTGGIFLYDIRTRAGIPEYTPAGCAPIALITQALSHLNYSLSSGPTTHCTVLIIYVVYIMFFICQFDCIVM